jgi:hypothetical protein
MKATRSGKWIATKENDRAGFHVVAPMIPFTDCTFGNLAKQFLSAKERIDTTAKKHERSRNTLRTYYAEYWGETKKEEENRVQEDALSQLEADYKYGSVYISPDASKTLVYVTADVQKYHLWHVAHAWSVNEKTGRVETSLIDYGISATFGGLDTWAGERETMLMGIDIGYMLRATKVADYCASYTDQKNPKTANVLALRGSDALRKTVLDYIVRDAREGKSSKGEDIRK